MDVETDLARDTSLEGITVKKSMIRHQDAVLGFSATPTIGKGEVVEYDYVSLLLENLIM